MLQIVDTQWKDHLYSLDHLKEGIGLRGYGQRDPLVEYKKESFELFQDMKARIEGGDGPLSLPAPAGAWTRERLRFRAPQPRRRRAAHDEQSGRRARLGRSRRRSRRRLLEAPPPAFGGARHARRARAETTS